MFEGEAAACRAKWHVSQAGYQVFKRDAAGELVADGGGDFFVAGAKDRVAQVIARFREIADGILLCHRGAAEAGELREDIPDPMAGLARYRFFFYSNDHEPVHVHVRHGGGEAEFDVRKEIALRESQGLKVKELAKAQALAEENKELIVRKWHEHLG